MTRTHRIPSKFLRDEGFPVVVDDAQLSGIFDDHVDDQSKWLTINSVDGVSIDEQFSPSEVLYRLARREYDRAFQQWSMQYVSLNDGGFLHKDYEQSAWDCWVIHCENNKPTNDEETLTMTDTMTVPHGSSLLAGPASSQVAIDACTKRLQDVINLALRAERGDDSAFDLFNSKVRELDPYHYADKNADDLFLAFRDLWNGYNRRNTYMRDLVARDKYTSEPLRVIFIVPDASDEYEAFMCLDCCGALSLLGIE